MELYHKKFKLKLTPLSLLLTWVQCHHYYLSEAPCAYFFSEENCTGIIKTFMDKDESIAVFDDQRNITRQWTELKLIKVQNSCSMYICNDTNFDGDCQSLEPGHYAVSDLNISAIGSARCACKEECKCQEDIIQKENSCARAYIDDECKSCYPTYVNMDETTSVAEYYLPKSFPVEYMNRVTSLKLRKGCRLTLYPMFYEEGDYDLITMDSESIENFTGPFEAFECFCENMNTEDDIVSPIKSSCSPSLINIPGVLSGIIRMLSDNRYMTHSGLRAAYQSYEAGRSSKNAYVLVLGATEGGKSTTINRLFDHPDLTGRDGSAYKIDEYRTPLAIDELGVANSELRVIDTPGLYFARGIVDNAKILATLDSFLANHEELRYRIPNVVLILFPFPDNRVFGQASAFVSMLKAIELFRSRITDKNYSNVVFVLTRFCSDTKVNQRRPKDKIEMFRKTVEDFTSFPRPITITVAENDAEGHNLPMINGYAKLPNKEFYPRNLFEKLELVTIKGSDPIGEGVFRSAFRDSSNFNITKISFNVIRRKTKKVKHYINLLAKENPGVRDVEILSSPRQVIFPTDIVVGYSYDIVKDRDLPISPFQMNDMNPSDAGFMIPNCVSSTLDPGIENRFVLLDDKQAYIQRRLFDLGLQGSVPKQCYNEYSKPGYNIQEVSFKNGTSHLSATWLFKLFELKLADTQVLTEEFKNAVQNLPKLNRSDYNIVVHWKKFFSDYGTAVVKSAYGGGAIEIKVWSDKPYDNRLSDALGEFMEFVDEIPFIMIREKTKMISDSERGVISKSVNHSLKFIGGDDVNNKSDFTNMTVLDACKFNMEWKKSLNLKPTILANTIKLTPLSEIVMSIGKNYSSAIVEGIALLFNSSLYSAPETAKNVPPPDRSHTPVMPIYIKQKAANCKSVKTILKKVSIE